MREPVETLVNPSEPVPREAAARRLLPVACVVFLTVGMSHGALGPTIPDLSRQTGAGVVPASGLLSAIFATSLIGQTISGLAIKRLGPLPGLWPGGAGLPAGGMRRNHPARHTIGPLKLLLPPVPKIA